MNGTMPSVSVIMPVYNAEKYVGEAVESILKQTFYDFEFVIIDDCSCEQVRDLLDSYRDPRIRLVRNEANLGLTRSLNKGLALARGALIARMDADDVSLPERLARQVRFLHAHAECLAVGCNALAVDPEGSPIRRMETRAEHDEIVSSLIQNVGGGIPHPTAVLRYEALVAVGGYREQYKTAQDLDLFLRLAERGQLANLPEVLLHYRLHPNSVSSVKWKEQYETARCIVQAACARRHIPFPSTCWPQNPKPPQPIDVRLVWGWQALRSGFISTARKYAWRALIRSPWSAASWRLAACALRGY